jgi:CRISPR-associated endonuclease Cas1
LNYAYALLRHLAEAEVLSLGLDPSLGLLHSDGRGKQPLLYDLMEVWRPMVDRWLLEWLLANPAANRWQQTQQGMRLSKEGRKEIASLFFEKAMASRGRGRKALSAQIGQECLSLQKHLQQTPYDELLTSFIENYHGKATPPRTQ